jgi:hypothetical protein
MIRVGDVVTVTEGKIAGIVESIVVHDDMTVYRIRSIYTGIQYGRELSDGIALAGAEITEQVRRDAQILLPASAECEVVKVCADGSLITQGMVSAEIDACAAWRPTSSGPAPWVIGVNASINMFV